MTKGQARPARPRPMTTAAPAMAVRTVISILVATITRPGPAEMAWKAATTADDPGPGRRRRRLNRSERLCAVYAAHTMTHPIGRRPEDAWLATISNRNG